ncbi:MAG: bifunctional diaminohydroxyphosphoribosylaminopyrimidine deaminase/5-amino-6-(5-phosphoribosylamino)uracil reductase RibD [Bdellovibrionota bacterium]
MIRRDSHWMQRALVLARKAWNQTYPNPRVGAIVLDAQGRLCGQGYHPRAGQDHAEIIALKQAGPRAKGGTLFATLEPCAHHGRTPPCAQALVQAQLKRVVVATLDPNPLVGGKGLALLAKAGIDVHVGIEETAARSLNHVFFHGLAHDRPFVHAKAALSSDGCMGHKTHRLLLTGPQARHHTMKLRASYQAIVTGIGTVLTDNPHLTVRGLAGCAPPARVILDSQLRCPLDAHVAQTSQAKSLVYCLQEPSQSSKAQSLRDQGVEVIGLDEDASHQTLNLNTLLVDLRDRGLGSLLLEAGPRLLTAFSKLKIVDRWTFYLSPANVADQYDPQDLIKFDPTQLFQPKIQSAIRMGQDLKIEATAL